MPKTKLYQVIADDLKQQINQGIFPPGSKIPSIRSLATQRKVSISSIQRALDELEMAGLIESKPKSGFYVRVTVKSENSYQPPRVSSVPKSVKIHEMANRIFHQCEEKGIVNLGIAYPHQSYSAETHLQKVASRVVRQHMPDILEAHVSSGYFPLRQILAERLSKSGCRLSADDIIVTNGCLEALSICLRAVAKPGDTIAIESPSFVGLYQVLESLGYKALEIPCHPKDGISLEALELALEQWDIKAVAIVPSFSNPLGSHMPEKNRQLLVELLSEKNTPLIEDDMLTELSFDGSRTKPCKAFDEKGLVLYCSSASKTIASGFRIGWIVPGAFYKEVSYFRTFSNLSVSNFAQIVIAEFVKTGRYDRHIKQMVNLLAQQMHRFQQLIEIYFPEGTRISYPGGGCILWVGLPNKINGYAFFEKAIQLGIAVIPGQISSASDKFNNCIRINCACDPAIDLEEAIKKLADLAYVMS